MASQDNTEATPVSLAPSALAATPAEQAPAPEKARDAQDEPTESTEPAESTADVREKRLHTTEPIRPETKAQLSGSRRDEDLVAKLLEFLSTATPGALGAVAAGLSLVTYLALGRIGLVLIGAFGGVVLYVSYEGKHPDFARAARGEAGNETIQRLLQQLKERAQDTASDDQDESEDQLLRSFDDFRPQTREAMKGLVDAVIRDYVKWWYTPVVPSDRSFPLASRKLYSSFLLSISNHLARKRPADVFLDFLTNSTSMIIVFFSELSAAFAELPPDSNVTPIDAVYNYLASNPDSNLSSLLNQKTQTSKFHMIADDLLHYLEKSAHDCEVVRVFGREIMANVILESTLRTCSQPEWINGWIVYLLEAGEPDFSQAIDVGMQSDREANPGLLPDLDHGAATGAILTAQTTSPEGEEDVTQKGEPVSNHKKKLSKAEEEMEEAMEEMKRLNNMIDEENSKRASKDVGIGKAEEKTETDTAGLDAPASSDDTSLGPRPSPDKAPPKDTSTDSHSSKGEAIYTPVTPGSTEESGSQGSSPGQGPHRRFTSFDQIVPMTSDTVEEGDELRKQPLTLHNATVTIHDEPGSDKSRIRSKPGWDYLIQIEPGSSHYPGWMIVRKYSDFETLHEVLRRIANISGATAFAEQHAVLPPWKVHTRESLRSDLERYLRGACGYRSLAESEGMKRFLDKDQGLPQNDENRTSFGFDMFGKNVMDALSTAPKGAMQGGKAVMGGVTGVLGNIGIGQKKPAASSASGAKDTAPANAGRLSISTPPRVNSLPSPVPSQRGRDSMDSQRSSVVSIQPSKIAPMEGRASSQFEDNDESRLSLSDRFHSPRGSKNPSRASSRHPPRSPSTMSLDGLKLPPPPSEVKDDYDPQSSQHKRTKTTDSLSAASPVTATSPLAMPPITSPRGGASPPKRSRQYTPLTEQEASVAVELMFAIINELYTLTSAWNIRRTLLGAAKSFLLRPGNPSLTSIRALIQESVLDTNTSDAGIAAHLQKLRENSLPTEEELAGWPAEMTQEEKDKLRDKARRLLIKSGVPAALTGVMGQSATSEAVGRVFDCLQIEEVARGLMFGIMLQAVRVVTH